MRILRTLSPLATLLCVLPFLAGCGEGRVPAPNTGTPPGNPPADFTLTASPASSGISATSAALPYTLTVTPSNGFAAALSLSLAPPAGVTCDEPACTLTLAAGTFTGVLHLHAPAPGNYALPFTATSGSVTHSTTASLTVTQAPDFALSVTPASTTVQAGSSGTTLEVTLTPLNGFSAPVNITASGSSGLSCGPACTFTATSGTTVVPVTVPATVPAGTYTLTFTATSGTLTHTASAQVTVTPAPQPDFTFTVAPLSATVTAGSATPAYSFTVTPISGFASPVTISAPAVTGFTCAQSPCSVTSSASSIPNALGFTTDASLAAGTYTLTFTATSGSLTHSATATIAIKAPPVEVCSAHALTPSTPQPGATAFIYTGSQPSAAVYDAQYNVIFATDRQLSRLLVLSPNTQNILASIPVIQPEGLDITPDGKTLIVGTDGEYFYRIDIASLCVIDRPHFAIPISGPPQVPHALSDGSIVFEIANSISGRWTPSGGAVSDTFGGGLVRSGDHTQLFYTGAYLSHLDLNTGKTTQATFPPGKGAIPVAANADGSRLYASTYYPESLTLFDTAFNVLATYKTDDFAQVLLSDDGTRLYVLEGYFPHVTVLDPSTLKVLGYASAQQPQSAIQLASSGYAASRQFGIDGDGRLLTYMQGLGVGLLQLGPLVSDSSLTPAQVGWVGNDNISLGASTAIQFSLSSISINPTQPTVSSLAFGEANDIRSASFQFTTPTGVIATVPSFTGGGCADLDAVFTSGAWSFNPQVFCYSPVIDAIDGDAGPATGGGTLTLWGKGFGPHPTVRIGGTPATSVTVPAYSRSLEIQPEQLTVTVPSGTFGTADISVSSDGPTTTLPGAYTYYNQQDAPLSPGGSPFQLLYDAPNDRLLWTDTARNLLVVASASTGQPIQQITVAASPMGLSLSPDGASLAIAFDGDNSIRIYDAHTFTLKQSATFPNGDPFIPYYPAFLNNGTVIIGAAWGQGLKGAYGFGEVLSYNLSANTITVLLANVCENIAEVVGSADGSLARVGSELYSAATGKFTPLNQAWSCHQVGISADGVINADPTSAHDSAGHVTAFPGGPLPIFGSKTNYGLPNNLAFPDSLLVNPSGSLAYEEFATSYLGVHTTTDLRIFDLNRGNLVRTVEVPDGFFLPFGGKLMAADPAGNRFWLFTTKALSLLTFPSDPLAVGEIRTSSGTLTVLGSGFSTAMKATIDGSAVSLTVNTATNASAALPALARGTHSLTLTNPGQPPYTVPVAIVIP